MKSATVVASNPDEARDLFQMGTSAPVEEERELMVRLSLNFDQETYNDLKRAQEISGDVEFADVMKKALKVYLEKKDLQKKEKVRVVKSKQEHPKRRGRLSLPVKVAVTKRDEGRCTYVDPKTGRRCTARTHLQYDHIVPFAVGGESTVDNIRLICRNHNQFLAKEYFGKDKVEREIARRRRGGEGDGKR